MWGVSPLFFQALAAVPPLEVVAHRIVWSLIAIGIVLALRKQGTEAIAMLRQPRALIVFIGSAITISINWLVFVHAVTSGRALQASLGYYVFPLVTVVLAAVFLRERFTRRQGAALGFVVAGVGVLVVGAGTVPWITLVLAFSFGAYGLLRKIAPAESLVGLFVETLLLFPAAVAVLIWLHVTGQAAFLNVGPAITLAVVLGTPLWTAFPLFLFAFGARRLRLSTVGLMQYINPTLQFVLAVFVAGEAFTTTDAATFGLIWIGIAVYSWPATAK